jgi:hypothetical protein
MSAETTAFETWQNFYVIVGSSAGALIGLQFVVIALLANGPRVPGQAQAGSAFATPNVVHFGTVLLLSALLSAPWHSVGAAAVLWGCVGIFGIIYEVMIARRMRLQRAYHPVLEDWLFHAVLPLVAYATLAVSAWAARLHPRAGLAGVAASALILLFAAIHNAWDAASYHIFNESPGRERSNPEAGT